MDKELEEKILSAKVISFDLFDTLVIRIFDNPEILFDLIGKKFNITNFKAIRTSMQNKCGIELYEKYKYPHANIDEIYDFISNNTKIENVNKIMTYEIKEEENIIYQNKKMYEAYLFAKKHNKRVIVTSDMYLKKQTINNILRKCEYNEIDRLYLSSEERKAKFDGTLYDFIIEEEKVLSKEILHIGDSLKDDINMAKSKGLETYHYKETNIKKSNSIALSLAKGIERLIKINTNDFWTSLGAKAGLMYMGLYEELLQKKKKKIVFLSRDGYNLYHIFKKFNKSVEVKYYYTSRRALLLASITSLENNTLNILPPFTLGQTIEEILDYICMREIFNIDDLKQVGFKSFKDRINSIEDINKFKKIYSLKEQEVLNICKKEREEAISYFRSLEIDDNDVLFFDCGWNGTSQYLLEKMINSFNPEQSTDFFYNGIINSEKSRKQLKDKHYSTYLFDINKNNNIANRIKDNIVIMELFFGSPENSVFKYSNGGYILDNYENDLNYKKNIYKGIELFFNYAISIIEKYQIVIDPKETIIPIVELIDNPTNEEAKTIGNIENVDAFAKQNGVHKYIANLSLHDIEKNKNIEIYWKYGLLKRDDIDEKVKGFIMKKYNIKKNDENKFKYKLIGINSPKLLITGKGSFDLNMEIKEDDKTIKTVKAEDTIDYNLNIICNLNKTKSIIEIYDNNNKLKTINNNKYNRFYFYIIDKLVKISKLLLIPFKILYKVLRVIKRAWTKYHFLVPPKVIKNYLKRLLKIGKSAYNPCELLLNPANVEEYNKWLKKNEKISKIEKLTYNPLISFVIPVYNVEKELLVECLESILNQTYSNIEICIADDCSTNKETIEVLKEYEKSHQNINVVYRKENGHISVASNTALGIAKGEYIAMMDDDDVIPPNAIYEMVKVLNHDKTIDMIYTDEDKINSEGKRCDPHFKTDYAPDTLLSVNYFCHFTLLRTSILKKIGGWKKGYESAQDWDLFLRFVEKAHNIYHLPKLLYRWRMIEGSVSMGVNNKKYSIDTAKKAIEDALVRRKIKGIVHQHDKVPYYWIEYKYEKEPMISIIIPTKDFAVTLNQCISSIYSKTTYKNFEIIIVDNRSEKKETFDLFKKYNKKYKNIRIIKADMEFNYSRINNLAIKKAKGEYIVLLNNDTKVITPNWLELLVGYAMQKHIGAVGAKLLYPDETVQHGGVIGGLGGVAGHTFINEQRDSIGAFGRLCVPYNYSAVTAACLIVEKKKYMEVNGLNEELKVAYNDVDFCFKLAKKGYYNVMLPMVELYHYESKTRGQDDTKEKQERFMQEINYMKKNWKEYIENDPMYNINLSKIKDFYLDND